MEMAEWVWIADVTWTPTLAQNAEVRTELGEVVYVCGGILMPGRLDDALCGSLQVRFVSRGELHEFIKEIRWRSVSFESALFEAQIEVSDIQGWHFHSNEFSQPLTCLEFCRYCRDVNRVKKNNASM
jgi:hypothetical protein